MRSGSRVVVALLIFMVTVSACDTGPPDAGPGERLPLTISWSQHGDTPDHSDLRVEQPGPPLVPHWSFSGGDFLPTGFSPPVISGGRIFVSDDSLFALDSRGEEQWSSGVIPPTTLSWRPTPPSFGNLCCSHTSARGSATSW